MRPGITKALNPNQQVGQVRKQLVDQGIEVPDPKLGETAEAYRGRLAERLREFREGVGGDPLPVQRRQEPSTPSPLCDCRECEG